MWQYCVLFAALCILQSIPTSGFWWPKATTETPRNSQLLQQIPLTYFRTYTYQPLTGGPFGVPLFGFGAAQTPLLSGRHYDPYAVTSYAAARRHDAGAAGYKPDITPPGMVSSTTTTTTPAPTTTTTTTTTTPAPTTTTTTTKSPTPTPSSSSSNPIESGAAYSALRYGDYNAEYPTYSRRVNNLYNARPQYPYPDYFNYQPPSPLSEKGGSRIQFVPCMCPVTMPSLSGLGLNSASTSTDRERTLGISISSGQPVVGVTPDITSLQARHIDSEEAELDEMEEEEEEEEQQAAAAAASSSDNFPLAEADVTKHTQEPQYTTPIVESNSVV